MELAIIIGHDGKPKAIYSMTNGAHILLASENALDFIMKQVESNGLACQECALVARSDELHDGVCKPGHGHMQDPDFDELSKLSGPVSAVRASAMAHNLLHKGIVALYKEHVGPLEEEKPGPTRPEAPGGEY